MTKKHKRKDGPITGLDGIQKAKVRRDYTREELMQMGGKLSREFNRIKGATTIFMASIKIAQYNAETLLDKITSGYEMVDCDVKAEFSQKTKTKRLFDLKTGEFLREEAMQPEDFQVGLPGIIGPAVGKEV